MKTQLKILSLLGFFVIFSISSCSSSGDDRPNPNNNNNTVTPVEEEEENDNIENFTLTLNGANIQCQVFVPTSYKNGNTNIPVIYLLDTEEGSTVPLTDEFEKVLEAVNAINLQALVVSSNTYLPGALEYSQHKYEEKYNFIKDMVSYIDSNYENDNNKRTLIGRGAAAGHIIEALFKVEVENTLFKNFVATDPHHLQINRIIIPIENDEIPEGKPDSKFYFSISGSYSNNYELISGFINTIENRNYSWLTFVFAEQLNSTTYTNYPTAYNEGIAYIFND